MAGRWFSPSIPVSSTNKTDRFDIAEILLKVALNTITLAQNLYFGNNYVPDLHISISSETLLIFKCLLAVRFDTSRRQRIGWNTGNKFLFADKKQNDLILSTFYDY